MKERIKWVDAAKCIGILCVILGHSHIPTALKTAIYSFHMPLFFFLSGVTFSAERNRTTKKQVSKIFRGVMLPYLVLSICQFLYKLIWTVIGHGSPQNLIKNGVGILLCIRETEYSVGLWFFPLLFIAECFFFALVRCKRTKERILFSSVVLVLGFLYAHFISVPLPWGIDAALIAQAFILAGYLAKEELKNLDLRVLSVAVIPWYIFAKHNNDYYKASVDMYTGEYGNPLVFLLAASFGILMIVSVAYLTSSRPMSYIGQRTLYIYGIHTLFIDLLNRVALHFGLGALMSNHLSGLVTTPIVLMLCLVTEPLYTKLFYKVFH